MRIFATAFVFLVVGMQCLSIHGATVPLYVGTYTTELSWIKGRGKGIHQFTFDIGTGALTSIGATTVGDNPTFIVGTHGKHQGVLYAVNEVEVDAKDLPDKTGYVYALKVDAESGLLQILNRVETGGASPAHVSVSNDDKYVAVANYGGGSVTLFPLNPDRSLQPATDIHQYNEGEYDSEPVSHMHSMTWIGGGYNESSAVFGADLGKDRIVQFYLDTTTNKLVPNQATPFINRPKGSGPRHMVIHPKETFAYVVDQFSSTIGVYPLNREQGTLATEVVQNIPTLPKDWKGINKGINNAADIQMTASGTYLYASNRGHDSIAGFVVGPDGQLTALGHTPTRGKTPRSILIVQDFLLAANQDTDTIQVFRIDQTTGILTYANQSASCGTPVSLFIPHRVDTIIQDIPL